MRSTRRRSRRLLGLLEHSVHAGHEGEIVVSGRDVSLPRYPCRQVACSTGSSFSAISAPSSATPCPSSPAFPRPPSPRRIAPRPARRPGRADPGADRRPRLDRRSNTSADHAVTIDPLTVERIEVLKGPAAPLFGGQAVGGAVNGRSPRPHAIPRTVAPRPARRTRRLPPESADRASADVALGKAGSSRRRRRLEKIDDPHRRRRIPPELHADELKTAEEELKRTRRRGRRRRTRRRARPAPSSQTEQNTIGAGPALIGDNRFRRLAERFDSNYGSSRAPVLGSPRVEPAEGNGHRGSGHHRSRAEPPNCAPSSVRERLLRKVRFRGAAGTINRPSSKGTRSAPFRQQGGARSARAVQRDDDGWRGASGARIFHRDF